MATLVLNPGHSYRAHSPIEEAAMTMNGSVLTMDTTP